MLSKLAEQLRKKVVKRSSIFNFRTAGLGLYTTSAVTTFSSTSIDFGSGSVGMEVDDNSRSALTDGNGL